MTGLMALEKEETHVPVHMDIPRKGHVPTAQEVAPRQESDREW